MVALCRALPDLESLTCTCHNVFFAMRNPQLRQANYNLHLSSDAAAAFWAAFPGVPSHASTLDMSHKSTVLGRVGFLGNAPLPNLKILR